MLMAAFQFMYETTTYFQKCSKFVRKCLSLQKNHQIQGRSLYNLKKAPIKSSFITLIE